jgi:N-acyl-D-amino-acid deacylase
MLIDGTGAGPVRADIALEGDRIRAVGDLSAIRAEKTVSIRGLCACPGFIDVHSHSDFTLLADGRAEGKICQGVTTEINGNCGMSAAPLTGAAYEQRKKELEDLDIHERWRTFPEYFSLLEKRKMSVNVVTLVGHGNLRACVAGYSDKPLSVIEKERAVDLLTHAMNSGAGGISTGLIYPPGIYSNTEEIITLASIAAGHGGIYATHMRSEGDRLIESVEEAIEIARGAGIHVNISHLKTSGEENWHKLGDVFNIVDQARRSGLSVTCDRYPYIASSTDLDSILPSWVFEGGRNQELERLRNDKSRIVSVITTEHPDESYWESVLVSSVNLESNKWMEGKNMSEIGASRGNKPGEAVIDILVEEEADVGAIFFSMNEDNLESVLKLPYTMAGSDSSARSFDGITAQGLPHPRGFGTFPRILGRYVRDRGVLSMSKAVHKMTGLPATVFGIKQRGIIAEGCFADIVVFDPEKIIDTADFNDPFKRPDGIHYVFVNGTPVVSEGAVTGNMPGRILTQKMHLNNAGVGK